jgi:hypothetical protein
MRDVSIMVVWQQTGCPYRQRNFEYVTDYYAPVVVSELDERLPWSKGLAIHKGLSQCNDYIAIIDADVIVPGLKEMLQRAAYFEVAWYVPFTNLHRLTEAATHKVLTGLEPSVNLPTEIPPYRQNKGGTAVIVRKDVIEDVPDDPRFYGWGKNDKAWRDAMITFYGEPMRSPQEAYHLWHPPHPDKGPGNKSLWPGNEELTERYAAARGNKTEMRKILDECKSLF